MKKLVLVIVMTVFGLANLFSQEIQFGAKGGLNLASIRGDNSGDFESVTSFNFGIMSEIPISEKFSFQPELMYSGQGYSIEDTTIKLNYLNMPLMGKYYVIKGLSLEAGPQMGFLLSAKNEDTDIKDSLNTVDLGVNFGIGYKLDNGLNFGLRYNLGLSDINDLEGVTNKNQNGVFQLSVGYFFF
ncbi:porin family protein [Rasiella sp. SM2506]|uniref:porin family protein n=1 Tax=Rasiella sp. SM2506 TaxID=3423914 RepID=UPI003D7AA201